MNDPVFLSGHYQMKIEVGETEIKPCESGRCWIRKVFYDPKITNPVLFFQIMLFLFDQVSKQFSLSL